jgi:hypothetical protein
MFWKRISIKLLPSLFLLNLAVAPAFCAELDYGSLSPAAVAATSSCSLPNKAVAEYFDLIRQTKEQQPELVEALRRFPKGADIHNHLSGTIMPEDYLAMGKADGDCYGPDGAPAYTIAAAAPSGACNSGFKPLATAGETDRLKILQSLSMYQYNYPDIQHGHDQFFATFGRFGAISGTPWNTGPMLARLLQQADKDSVSYVETMISFQSQAINTLTGLLRQKFSDDSFYRDSASYPALYAFLVSVGLKDAIAGAQSDITQYVNRTNALLRCGLSDRDPACGVSYAFLASVNRNAARKDGSADLAKIFTQTAFSMLLDSTDSRVVGVNLLSGEDADISMQSFADQMQFFSYFHKLFPDANIALHAGEFTPCFVGSGNPALKEHLSGSLKAGAKRIGHGVSFSYLSAEDKAEVAGLMKKNDAVAEIMFTSNAQILGVAGDEHPFVQYRDYGIPIAFATDDAGVSHADFTSEWVYGFKRYGLSGKDLLRLARESLQHSFIPGAALWANLAEEKVVSQCVGITPGSPNPPEPCKTFLGASARAKAQWDYEARLAGYLQGSGKKYAKYLWEPEQGKVRHRGARG